MKSLACYLYAFLSLIQPLFGAENLILSGYLDTRCFARESEIPFSLNLIEPHLLNDLYVAFWGFGIVSPFVDPKNSQLTGDFKLQPLYISSAEKLFRELQLFKKRTENRCNILICLGGWGFNDPLDPEKIGTLSYTLFSKMAAAESSRKEFIASCIQTLKETNFDGIDLDWEYPGDLLRGGSTEDLANYLLLLKEMHQAFKENNPKWILSVALPATVPAGLPQKYRDSPEVFYQWIGSLSEHVDRITLMAYDYHGTFDRPKLTGVNAPLYRDFSPESTLYIEYSLNNYLKNKVPAEKIVLGMPLYGRGYEGVEGLTTVNNTPEKPFRGPTAATEYTQTPGLLAFAEIQAMIDQKTLFFAPDIITDTARAYNVEKKIWISFDTPETIGLKAGLSLKKKLKGAVFWSIDLDQYTVEPPFPTVRHAKKVLEQAKD